MRRSWKIRWLLQSIWSAWFGKSALSLYGITTGIVITGLGCRPGPISSWSPGRSYALLIWIWIFYHILYLPLLYLLYIVFWTRNCYFSCFLASNSLERLNSQFQDFVDESENEISISVSVEISRSKKFRRVVAGKQRHWMSPCFTPEKAHHFSFSIHDLRSATVVDKIIAIAKGCHWRLIYSPFLGFDYSRFQTHHGSFWTPRKGVCTRNASQARLWRGSIWSCRGR